MFQKERELLGVFLRVRSDYDMSRLVGVLLQVK